MVNEPMIRLLLIRIHCAYQPSGVRACVWLCVLTVSQTRKREPVYFVYWMIKVDFFFVQAPKKKNQAK